MAGKTKATFLEGSILRSIISFMLPVLLALVLQAAYGAVDLIIVGRFCPESVGAVGTGSSIMHMITVVITGFATGSTVLIGHHIGERDAEKAGDAAGTTVVLFALIALVCTLIAEVFAEAVTHLMHIPEGYAFAECVRYIRICAAGIPVIVAYNVISGILRGTGDARLPLLFVAIACIVNIMGDYILVALCGMGAAGAAIATVLAQGVSVLCSAVLIRKRQLPIAFNRKKLVINKEERNRIFSIGGPLALQEFMVQISFMVVNSMANSISPLAPSSYAIAQKVVSFIMLIPGSVGQSVSAFVAQNFGAGQHKRARKGYTTAVAIGCCVGAVIFVLAFFYGDRLCRLFLDAGETNAADIIQGAFDYLRGFAPDCILTCMLFSTMGYFTGRGRSLPVMLEGISSAFLIRIPACLIFRNISSALFSPLFYIGLATPVTTVYGIIYFAVCFILFSDRRKRKRKVPQRADAQ